MWIILIVEAMEDEISLVALHSLLEKIEKKRDLKARIL
jgi:hypothetical protein